MNRLHNPFKGDVVTRVTANVGQAEWDRIRAGGAMIHGHQDKIVSMLLHKFHELTESELPEHYDLESEETLARLIERLALAPDRRAVAGPTAVG